MWEHYDKYLENKSIPKMAEKMRISDELLVGAVKEMQQGLINADLGSGVVKKRIAREGSGKRSGYRTLIATNRGSKWFFVYGFSKNERENLDTKELGVLKELADYLLYLSQEELINSIRNKAITEIKCHEK